jgi:hypothetical protein
MAVAFTNQPIFQIHYNQTILKSEEYQELCLHYRMDTLSTIKQRQFFQ